VLQTDELAQVAEQLRREGIDAEHDFVFGSHMWMEGLEIDDEFFPLWELIIPDNCEAFERRDFAAIKARRGPNWTIEPPRAACAAEH
jgi:hypothetical protein